MGPVSDLVVGSFGDTILVELGTHVGTEAATWAANEILIDKPLNAIIPVHAANLATTGVKTLTITLKYKHTVEDAQLGFFRSASHADPSLFASVGDYLAVEKGWFSPYLFASARRPIIPRNMKPDFVFCHGPFLSGDYRVGETLVAQSAKVLLLCEGPVVGEDAPLEPTVSNSASFKDKLNVSKIKGKLSSMMPGAKVTVPPETDAAEAEKSDAPPPTLQVAVPPPRRLAVLVLGLKPHRLGMWTSSARPSESVLQ